MPDASGRIPPVFFDAEAWSRVFSVEDECEVCGQIDGCEGENPDCPPVEITWTPDPILDGAHFTAE